MCVAGLTQSPGVQALLGDPIKRDQERTNRLAREDSIRAETFAHEKEMAGMSNRSQLGTNAASSSTNTSKSSGKINQAY